MAKLLIAAVLAALVVWIARNTYWEKTVGRGPPTGEAASDPLYAARKFAQALGARAQRDGSLEHAGTAGVVFLYSWNWELSEKRRREIQQWVESGGRLVVDESLNRSGDGLGLGPPSLGAFASWSGINRVQRPQPVEHASTCPALTEESDTPSHPARQFAFCGFDTTTYLATSRHAIWALRGSTGLQALRVRIGQGSVTAINGEPFRYLALFGKDQAALFVALTQLRAGDEIRFVSEQDQASLVALSWRYGAPAVVLFLLAAALALWRSSARFGPLEAAPQIARRSLAEQIRGTGQFAARTGGAVALHAATLRALHETASRYIRGYAQLASTEQVAVIARHAGVEMDALTAATHYSGARRGAGLRNSVALLESARRRILMSQARSKDGN
jgi:hypothetical protein